MKPSSGLVLVLGALLVGCASASVSPLATHSDDGGADAAFDLATDAAHVVGPPDLLPPPCTINADCATSPLGAVCDTTTGTCVQCVASNDTCPAAHYCDGTSDTCAAGCKSDSDCTTGGSTAQHCDTTTHECVGCNTDSDCAAGTICNANTCVPGCNTGHACDTGKTCCSGLCDNLMTDATHCGACGNVCDTTHSTGATCMNGGCAYTGCQGNYADCITTAPDTDGCETSATTTANCGKCGSCEMGGIIESSSCVVPQTGPAACEYQCGCETGSDNTASTCNGTSCSYTCSTGHADCNSASGSNTDGCECATAATAAQGAPGCCASGTCQTVHQDGETDNFYDCVALGTYNATQAFEAAAAAIGISGTASDGWTCGTGSNVGTGVCKQSATTCGCWVYKSTGNIAAAGHVHYNANSNSCFCAQTGDNAWD